MSGQPVMSMTRPWTRLHFDYCEPVAGKLCLVVAEAFPVSSAISYITIEKLRFLFSQFGLPESVVSDNAAYFVAMSLNSFYTRMELNIQLLPLTTLPPMA